MLENLPIPGLIADPEWGNSWNVGKNQSVSAYLNGSGNLCLRKDAKFTLHTVLNATASDLEMLPHGLGVPVSPRSAFTVSLDVASRDEVEAQLAIHEFNMAGKRISRTLIANKDRVLYAPGFGAVSLAISIRLAGKGEITVRGLEFSPALTSKFEPGVHRQGSSVKPGNRPKVRNRDEYVWLLPIRKALFDGTPLQVLFRKPEAVEAASLLISRGFMLEAKELVRQCDSYQDLTTSHLRKLFWHGRRTGYVTHALAALDEVILRTGNEKDVRAREVLFSEHEFHRNPWSLLQELPSTAAFSASGPVLHMVGKALPEWQTGFTLRTKYTTEALSAAGVDCVIAVQSGGNHAEGLTETIEHTVAGVPTVLFAGPAKKDVLRHEWMQRNAEELYRLVHRLKPSVIHAHSDFTNGALATHVGEATSVPVVYETRGFWEETWLSRIGKVQNWENLDLVVEMFGAPELYTLRRETERNVRERADQVVTLAETMKEFILQESSKTAFNRGRVSIATNAVDPGEFPVPSAPSPVRKEFGIPDDSTVVGYISSIVEYEGIETLLDGYKLLSARQPDTHLLVVGDGPQLNHLKQHVARERIPRVIFTGRVPHDEVLAFYHAIDIFVVPRRRTRVTELVTPLKPFEAFSTGRAVVLSDVAALKEIAEDSQGAARTFQADDSHALATVLEELVTDPDIRRHMGERAAEWVRSARSWASNTPAYKEVYRRLREAKV